MYNTQYMKHIHHNIQRYSGSICSESEDILRKCVWVTASFAFFFPLWEHWDTEKEAIANDSNLYVSKVLWNKVRLQLPISSYSTVSLEHSPCGEVYKCVCKELSLFQNQARRLKCLIICEVGLKLFPLLGDFIKWLSAGEIHQIPRANKSSKQPLHLLTNKANKSRCMPLWIL